MNNISDERVEDIKRHARGHWTQILKAMGVDEKILSGRNQPCPIGGCGGTDRFQYTDKFGEGNYHCRSCGVGGGIKLGMSVLGLSFPEILSRLEGIGGVHRSMPAVSNTSPDPERMKALSQRIWNEAKPVTQGDEVDRYLRNRGLQLEAYPRTLRFHPALGYFEKQVGQQRAKKVAEFPAMLACVQGSDGHAVTLHRTYLKDGYKALGSESKKVLSSGINGAAIRLAEATQELAIVEGIETGLAVLLNTGKPVWAAINCLNMERLWIPKTVRHVCIYADNDSDSQFDGQASAYALARRLKREEKKITEGEQIAVKVFVPKNSGSDWADVRLARLANERKAA